MHLHTLAHRRHEPISRHRVGTAAVTVAVALAVVVLLLAVLPDHASAVDRDLFRKAPYLIYNGNPGEMEIHWQLVMTATCNISWGTDETCSDGTATTYEYWAGHQHSFTIDGLEDDTLYHYGVTDGHTIWQDAFRTPPGDDAGALKFLAYGDTRSYPAQHDNVAAGMLATIHDDPMFQTMVILTGDLINDGNSDGDWDQQFFDPGRHHIRRFHASVPTLAARGNHEGSAIYYRRYLPYPFVDATYWSYDYGPAHFIVIDQYVDYSPGSAQYDWLLADLAANDRPWTFMYLHEPGWSAGGGHSNEVPVQQYLHPLCEQYDIPILFGGHNHYYSRAVVGDVHHITTGGGGAPLRTPDPSYPHIVITESTYHFCKLEIDGDLLTCTVVRPDGTLVDEFTVDKAWTGVAETPAQPPLNEPALALARPAPNPFSSDVSLSLELQETTHLTVSVYDIRGRRLTTLHDETTRAGTSSHTWDGRDEAGRALPSGVYFARAVATGRDGGTTVDQRTIVLLR